MASIFKTARWNFLDGPLENHLGFVGEEMGKMIQAVEVEGAGRYEKIGQGIEDAPDGSMRVVFAMSHVFSPNDQTEGPSPRQKT